MATIALWSTFPILAAFMAAYIGYNTSTTVHQRIKSQLESTISLQEKSLDSLEVKLKELLQKRKEQELIWNQSQQMKTMIERQRTSWDEAQGQEELKEKFGLSDVAYYNLVASFRNIRLSDTTALLSRLEMLENSALLYNQTKQMALARLDGSDANLLRQELDACKINLQTQYRDIYELERQVLGLERELSACLLQNGRSKPCPEAPLCREEELEKELVNLKEAILKVKQAELLGLQELGRELQSIIHKPWSQSRKPDVEDLSREVARRVEVLEVELRYLERVTLSAR